MNATCMPCTPAYAIMPPQCIPAPRRRASDLASQGSASTLTTAVSEALPTDLASQGSEGTPPTQRKWCNFLYSTRCPFCSKTDANVVPCKFTHIDTYVNMDVEERSDSGMPNLMMRHVRNLEREMTRIVDDKARRVLNAWMVVKAWGGAEGSAAALNPYWDTVDALRNLGWVIPEVEQGAWTKLEDAPHAKDVATILGVAASCLHYNVNSSTNIMFRTVAWVFGEEAPVLHNPEPQLDVGDIMGAFVDATSDLDYEDMPELLDSMSCLEEPPVAPPTPAPISRKERRAMVFAQMKKQKALRVLAARAARLGRAGTGLAARC